MNEPAENPVAADSPSQEAEQPSTSQQPLRIWPAIILLILLWALKIGPRFIDEQTMAVMMSYFFGPLFCCAGILLWWLLFSRAQVKEKLIGLIGLVVASGLTWLVADKSIEIFGMMIFVLPTTLTAFAGSLLLTSRHKPAVRTGIALTLACLTCGFWTLVRTDEIRGDFSAVNNWRWEPTAEDEFLETLNSREKADVTDSTWERPASPEWPGFRGPERNGIQPDVILQEDWSTTPPKELWSIAIGPGWSSFAVAGDRIFTQEQRGENEAVVCYEADSGREVWSHSDESRFWEVVAGAGPRATPTLSNGSLYALGANGLLNCLNPANGELLWQQDIRKAADREPPVWGFSSSPLVTHGKVIVHAGGENGKGLLAYDAETGDLAWTAKAGSDSYSSAHLKTIAGRDTVFIATNAGLDIVDPTHGATIGQHAWPFEGHRVLQPLFTGESDVLIATSAGTGTRRITVALRDQEYSAETVWTSSKFNPDFNDSVAHEGYLYGFDGGIFTCINLEDGSRKWKRGRYGKGQVVLLPEQDQLLVISEDGELVLLRATPDRHEELTRFQALDGRTWNHPVLTGDRLYVRNAEQAACYRMPVVSLPADTVLQSKPIKLRHAAASSVRR